MKSRVRSILSPRNESRYLKPGALAQLRDSRIRKPQISVYQLISASLAAASTAERASLQSGAVSALASMDASVPCFDLKSHGSPRCLRRKKLVAVTPIFAASPSES